MWKPCNMNDIWIPDSLFARSCGLSGPDRPSFRLYLWVIRILKNNNRCLSLIMDAVKMIAKFDTHGNRMKIYSCQSEIAGKIRRYELKFELKTCKWFLYKM